MAIWLGAVQCLLPAGNQSCEPRPWAQHPAGLWNQIFIVHKASAKYEESALPNKTQDERELGGEWDTNREMEKWIGEEREGKVLGNSMWKENSQFISENNDHAHN